MSQSEDERGSNFLRITENIDVITDAVRWDEETEVLGDEDIKIEPTESSQKASHRASNVLDVDPELIKMYFETLNSLPHIPLQ